MGRLDGLGILVTGGSSGIGLGLLRGFLEQGAEVVFTHTAASSLKRPKVSSLLAEFPRVRSL
ncbi:MAG: short chain dehydrogenase, partial [Proteobacteria bacterium]|nr:short chain dehydrogenase [Pseudomonadota bacterium]